MKNDCAVMVTVATSNTTLIHWLKQLCEKRNWRPTGERLLGLFVERKCA